MRALAALVVVATITVAPEAWAAVRFIDHLPMQVKKPRPKKKPKKPVIVDAGPSPDLESFDAEPLDAAVAATSAPDVAAVEVDAGPPPPEPPPPAPEPAPPAESGLGPLSGRLFAHVRLPTSSPLDRPIQQASTSVWISAHPRFGDVASAKVTLTADALYSSLDPGTTLRASVREGYVQAASRGWDVRLGQQILPWGNADGVNPTDFLTARDFTFFSADPEVRRLGAFAARIGWTPNAGDSPFELVVVAQPVAPSSRLLVPAGLLPPGVTDAGLQRPVLNLRNVETAARAAYNGQGWDIALVTFRGYNHVPRYALLAHDPATNATTIGTTNDPEIAFGGQTSASFGSWVLRAEGAYVTNDNASMQNPALQPARIDGVVGIERAFGERFRAQLQGIVRYHPTFRGVSALPSGDPVVDGFQLAIAQANALLLNYQQRTRPAGTLRLAYTSEEDTFEAEVFVFVNVRSDVSTTDYLVRPMVTYRVSDPLKFQLGAELYGGPVDTPLGAVRGFSGGFVEGSYSY